MDSINGLVSLSNSMEVLTTRMEAQNNLFKKTLENQKDTILSLVGSLDNVSPKLSHSGNIGTNIHITA